MNNLTSDHSSDILLEAHNISHHFDYNLFDNINLTLHKNQSIAIMGSSGSGKSTLLNILCSLLTPISGEVIFNDQNIFNLSQKEILNIRRDFFGIIFQSHYLFRGFNAMENLEIASLLTDEPIDHNILKALKIDHVMTQGIGELSGGQQQRLSCARVLTKKPDIIFADEPTGNLDSTTAFELMDVLFDYIQKNDAGMILVTHEEKIAQKCDIIYELIDNKLIKKEL
jgi:putative ABC transport system ATP-binding protein